MDTHQTPGDNPGRSKIDVAFLRSIPSRLEKLARIFTECFRGLHVASFMGMKQEQQTQSHSHPPQRPEIPVGQGYYRDEEDTLRDKHSHELQEAVMSALKSERRINSSQLIAAVEDGVLHLSGTVPDMKMKLYAEEAVEDIPGIEEIHNNITVSVPPDPNDIGPYSAEEKMM